MNSAPTVTRLVTTLQSIASAVAITVMVTSSLILLGWIFDNAALRSLFTTQSALRFNIGLCILLLGIGLFSIHKRPRLAEGLAMIVLLITVLTLSQDIFGIDLGIDQLVIRDPSSTAVHPGRMSIFTAIIFILAGSALLLLASKRAFSMAQGLAATAFFCAILVILGRLYGVPMLYNINQPTGVVLHSAFLFCALCIGMLLAFPDKGFIRIISEASAGGYLLRVALPVVVLTPLIVGWLEWQGEIAEMYEAGFGLAMLTLAHMVILGAFAIWIAGRLHKADLERLNALAMQQQTNDQLEARTRELVEVNQSLAQEVLQRKQAEAEIRILNTELEQRVEDRTLHLTAIIKELDSFNYSVSHDLRSPLRAMDGYAQALLEDQGDLLDDTAKRYLTRIRSASQRMGEVIDDLLQLAQLSRAEMVRSPVDVQRVAQDVIAELKEMEPERKVDYSIAETPIAMGDARLIRVVMYNLLSNAWKFTRKQSHPKIEMGTIDHDGKQAYFVRDNGVGFDMRFINKLFRAFQRLHDVQDFEGTGIGLAIVARIVQRHGGQIWAEGAVGQGATFYFTL
jgi:signal transduction histidine kinase